MLKCLNGTQYVPVHYAGLIPVFLRQTKSDNINQMITINY